MKTRKHRFAARLVLSLSLVASMAATTAHASKSVNETADDASVVSAPQAQTYGALERGYRTGYSDGYQVGWGDSGKRGTDYRNMEDYRRADRAYIAAYGSLEDYRDGYQQGFEIGYEAGYNRRGFESEVPASGIRRRGATAMDDGAPRGVETARSEESRNGEPDASMRRGGGRDIDDTESSSGVRGGGGGNRNSVPTDTIMRIELLNRISSDVSQRGDRFEARVLEPAEYAGATVSGRVAGVQRAGRTRGRSELQLDFDQIRLSDGGWQDFSAQVIEVIDTGSDEQGEVDPEGGVRGKDSTKDDVAKVGASAGVGAIIGAIAGGGKGAAIGAIIGGAAGTGGVMSQRGKEIRFEQGQQLRIRTAGEARVRDN